MGIAGISPGPNLSKRNPEYNVYPYLLRNVTCSHPIHVLGYRYHLDSTERRLDVPISRPGLVLPLRDQLGAG